MWALPLLLTTISWSWAYIQDRKDPYLGQLWSYNALGMTVASWIFYAIVQIVL
jgi:hypothetical protein